MARVYAINIMKCSTCVASGNQKVILRDYLLYAQMRQLSSNLTWLRTKTLNFAARLFYKYTRTCNETKF